MFYQGKELRRQWEVEVYDGNPDAKKPKTHKETVVAWNSVDAIRRCGNMKVAKPPVEITYVTWPETDDDGMPIEPTLKIDSTAGPSEEVVETTLGSEADWVPPTKEEKSE